MYAGRHSDPKEPFRMAHLINKIAYSYIIRTGTYRCYFSRWCHKRTSRLIADDDDDDFARLLFYNHRRVLISNYACTRVNVCVCVCVCRAIITFEDFVPNFDEMAKIAPFVRDLVLNIGESMIDRWTDSGSRTRLPRLRFT